MKKFFLTADELIGDDDPLEKYEFDFVCIKLVNGDLVLSQAVQVDDNNVLLFCPFILDWEFDEFGNVEGYAFVQFAPGSDSIFYTIGTEKIMSAGYMSDKYFDSYMKGFNVTLELDQATNEPKSEENNVVEFKPKVLH